jgi:hypothetical protein
MGDGAKLSDIEAHMATLIGHKTASQHDFDEKGIALYSSLIEFGRFDLMVSIFPIIHKLLGKNFKEPALDYFEAMPPRHYNLNRAAENFASYLADKCPKLIKRYPFLSELADYEWIELLVLEQAEGNLTAQAASKNVSVDDTDWAARFATLAPVFTSAIVARKYKFDIPAIALSIKAGEKLSAKLLKPSATPVGVIVFRDPVSLDARFLEVGEVAMNILEMVLAKPGTSYGELLSILCANASPEEAGSLLTGSLAAIEQFKNFNLIVREV